MQHHKLQSTTLRLMTVTNERGFGTVFVHKIDITFHIELPNFLPNVLRL